MNRQLLITAAIVGVLGGLAVLYGRKALLKFQIGADAYNYLGALQPRITQPVIRVGPPPSLNY